jgi:hypothetical protein
LESVAGAEEFDLVEQRVMALGALRQVVDAFPREEDYETIAIDRYAAGAGSNPLYEFWRAAGKATAERICGANVRLLDGDPFLVRRIRALCPDVAASGTNLGIVTAASAAAEWAGALTLYGARFVRHDLADVVLFDTITRQADPAASPLSGDRLKLTASDGRGGESLAMDGRLDTRWGSHAPQRPGMTFTIELPEPTDVAWVKVRIGRFARDRARALSIETSPDGERWDRRDVPTIMPGIRWNGDVPEVSRDGDLDLRIDAQRARFVRLVNHGESTWLDWSIAEVAIEGRPSR